MGELALKDGDRYLFMGDSITDCGRRESVTGMGNGYAAMVPGLIAAEAPQLRVEFFNRGIGGDNLAGLEKRWQEDCLDLRPTWMSLLIGINDLHCYLFGDDENLGPQAYAERYETLLSQVREATGCRFLLLEPFYFTPPPGADERQRQVLEVLPRYIEIVHQMAAKFDAKLIRTHEWGQELIRLHGADMLCPEPVHPNVTGHAAMASWLLKALRE